MKTLNTNNMKNNHKGFANLVLIGTAILLAVLGGYFVWKKNHQEAVNNKGLDSGYYNCLKNNGKTGVNSEAAYCEINGQYYYLSPPPGYVN